jgi:hypothetical protein
MHVKSFTYLLNVLTLILFVYISIGAFIDLILLPEAWLKTSPITSLVTSILYFWAGTATISLIITQLAKLFNVESSYRVWVPFNKRQTPKELIL